MGFRPIPGSGSLPLLFTLGGLSVGTLVLSGYFAALNYANGTVMWPIIPGLVIAQILAPFLHWRLILLGAPLWGQYCAYVFTTMLAGVVAWWMVKGSHQWLGELLPLQGKREHWKKLATISGWSYLASLGGLIYYVSDRLVINAWIGPGIIPSYQANYKVCELGVTLAVTASAVGFPKIVKWLSSGHAADRERVIVEMNRLNAFQIALGCGIALGYLALNDWFIRLWLGAAYNGPWGWQAAFACNLVLTTAGAAGMQINSTCGENAVRRYGLAVGGTGLLNLGLSMVAAHFQSTTGVAVATVFAQLVLSLFANWYIAGYIGLPRTSWLVKSVFFPTVVILIAALVRLWMPPVTFLQTSLLLAIYVVVFIAICGFAGLTPRLLRSELTTLRGMLGSR
jgi:O-antigen/teichoic acid export membrane protein